MHIYTKPDKKRKVYSISQQLQGFYYEDNNLNSLSIHHRVFQLTCHVIGPISLMQADKRKATTVRYKDEQKLANTW